MFTRKSNRWGLMKTIAVCPLALGIVFMYSSCTNSRDSAEGDNSDKTEISANGADPGAQSALMKPVAAELSATQDAPLIAVEKMPEFPGGQSAMMKFLADNMTYPDSARKANVQGTVVLTFVVGVDGTISAPSVVRSLSPDCDAEAIRVVKLMPKWTPGEQEGKQVKVQYNLPVRFTIK